MSDVAAVNRPLRGFYVDEPMAHPGKPPVYAVIEMPGVAKARVVRHGARLYLNGDGTCTTRRRSRRGRRKFVGYLIDPVPFGGTCQFCAIFP